MIKRIVVTLLLASATDAFVARSKPSRALHLERIGEPKHSIRQGSRTWMVLERAEKVEQKIDGPRSSELVMIRIIVVAMLLASATDAFVARSRPSRALHLNRTGGPKHSIWQGIRTWMMLETAEKVEQQIDGPDVTELGSLKVPSVGIGAISWSIDSSKY